MEILTGLTLLSLALLTGNEVCVAAFVEPILRDLPEPQQVSVGPRFASRLGRFMPLWYPLTLLLTAAQVVIRYRQSAVWWSGTTLSLALQLVVLALTLAPLVPRNTRLARMTQAYPGWQTDAKQWDELHRVRVVLLLFAIRAFIWHA